MWTWIRGEVRYSIQKMPDGTQYVEVDTDQDIFDGVDLKDYPRIVAKYIRDHFRGTPIQPGIIANRRSSNEYAGRRGYMTDDVYEAKVRAATELDNLMAISVLIADRVSDDGTHPEAVNGWSYYRTIFKVNGRWFEGTMNIMNRQYYSVFYDMKSIKDITGARSASNRITTGNVFTGSVAQNQTGINGQNGQNGVRKSMTALDQEYMDAVEAGDMETAARMVEEAAKQAGYKERH